MNTPSTPAMTDTPRFLPSPDDALLIEKLRTLALALEAESRPANAQTASEAAAAIEARNRSTPAPRISSPEAKVKPLEWERVEPGIYSGAAWRAESLIGAYLVQRHGAYFDNELIAPTGTIPEAKAVAQAHFSGAVLSSLAPSSPAGEMEGNAPALQGTSDPHTPEEAARLLAKCEAAAETFKGCPYRGRSDGGNDPQDCDWPTCECDPLAVKVIDALVEQGLWPSGGPSAYMVYNTMVAKGFPRIQSREPERDVWLYPASRAEDASRAAKTLRGELVSLYAIPNFGRDTLSSITPGSSAAEPVAVHGSKESTAFLALHQGWRDVLKRARNQLGQGGGMGTSGAAQAQTERAICEPLLDFVEDELAALASPVPPPLPGEAEPVTAYMDQIDAGMAGEAWLGAIVESEPKDGPPGEVVTEAIGVQGTATVWWRKNKPRAAYFLLRDNFNYTVLLKWSAALATPPARAPGITEEMVERAKAAFSAVYGAGLSRTDAGWKDNTDKALRAALEAASISRPAEREKANG